MNLYGKQKLKGVGKNPRLAQAKSKNDKNISGLLSLIEGGKIGIHTFTNASAFTVRDQDTKIISIEFATSEDNHAQFFGQVIVDVNATAVTKTATASGDVVISSVAVDEPEPLDPDNPEIIGNTEEQTVSVSLPISWMEDGNADSHKLGLGSNHGDVLHWFPKFGKNMDTVRADVAALMGTTVVAVADTSSDTDNEKVIWDYLMGKIGNAYGVAGLMGSVDLLEQETGFAGFCQGAEEEYRESSDAAGFPVERAE